MMKLLNLSKYISPKEEAEINDWSLFFFKLLEKQKEYSLNLINQWIISKHGLFERYACLKIVDEETYNNTYQRLFNPVIITAQENKEKSSYSLECMLVSVDDAAYRFEWENINRLSVDQYIFRIISWVDSIEERFNYKDFVNYGLSLGASDSSW